MGGSERSVRATLLLLIIVTVLILSCFYGNVATNCIEYEKQALLTFKQDLTDPSNRLSSWIDGVDCCKWSGIVCNNITGHVTELQLNNSDPYRENSTLGGSLNPSLIHLQQLQVLDLSMNNFSGVRIPSFIGSIHSLRHLNLSEAGFQGVIPHQLGNLSNLRSLSVEYNFMFLADFYYFSLRVDNIQWLAGLSNLERLDMSYVDFSEASNWLQVINMIPSLTELRLSRCSLSQIPHITDFNLSSLTILDLFDNRFTFPMPRWIFDLTKLVSLDLTFNYFEGPLPEGFWNLTSLNYLYISANGLNGTLPRELLNLSSLVELDLSMNELSGTIPNTIGKLCKMNVLILSINKLEGPISDAIDGMAGCFSYAVQYIYLDRNQFSGQITDKVGQFQNLIRLNLGFNSISGPIPPNVGLLSSLEKFILSYNKLNGTLPHSLGQLSKLEYLNISCNMMEGIVAQSLLENLTSLRFMYAFGNSMTLEVDQNWVPRTQYEALGLRSWKLGPQFPNWIQSQKKISNLDLSFTGISGAIPSWIWSLNMEFFYLNLSHNQLQGEISTICCFYHLDLHSNKLSGQLPRIGSKGIHHLDLSNNSFFGVLSHFLCDQMNETREMWILNLGNNFISGEIPECWMNWPSLEAINLDNNNLTGSIPKSIGLLHQLRFLHLRNNSLSGGIPLSLEHCTSLRVIDLAENKLTRNIPIWLGLRFLHLRILILRSNMFQGELKPELCRLTYLQIIDVASNNLSGIIPSCVNNFKSMVRGENDLLDTELRGDSRYSYIESIHLVTKGNEYDYDVILRFVTSIDLSNNNFSGKIPDELTFLSGLKFLNLSGNQLGGMIPAHIGKMVQLESLDLSRNQLSRSIPSGISQLSFLDFLNLSYNNLSGEIPLSSQMQSFDVSSFVGNQLCWHPLTENCTNNDNGVTEIEEDDAENGVHMLYIFMVSGFVVGFWGVCCTLILKRSWRYAYFRFVDEVWFKIYFSSTKYLFKR